MTARTGQRGAAMIEAVVMLPVLLVLLIGEQWLFSRHAAELQTAARARTCAWLIATSGCEEIPPECHGFVEWDRGGNRGASSFDEARDRLRGANWLTDTLLRAPILGSALEAILPVDADATVRDTLQAPALFGGVALEVRGRSAVPCNELPHEESVFREVLHAAAPSVF